MQEAPTQTTEPRFRAVLFDFDGTLADSYPGITASVNHVRALHQLPPLSEAEVRHHVGRGAAQLLEHTVGTGDPQANLAAYRAHHPSVLRSGTSLLPGAADTLRLLHQRGIRLGLCSNKPIAFTLELLTILNVAHFFDVVLGPENVRRPKPAPDMLQEARRRLDLPSSDILYVGDMTIDIQTARAAGITVWVVPTGSDEYDVLAQAKPDRLLHSLQELPALIGGHTPG
jgi:2-phosphoglycolate phosphatase